MSLTVIKIGGSLFDHPRLGPGLREWLTLRLVADHDERLLLLPGGGPIADTIRDLDRIHQLGDEIAHWLAIGTLRITAKFLSALLPNIPIIVDPTTIPVGCRIAIVNADAFLCLDEANPDHLPHTWAVTSDAIAARVAHIAGADRLVLFKSTSIEPDTDWNDSAERGIVDPTFPHAIAHRTMTVEVLDFRAWLHSAG